MESESRSWGRVWASQEGVRLFLFALATGSAALSVAFFSEVKNLSFVHLWTIGAIGTLGAAIGIVRARALESVIGWSLIVGISTILWWVSIVVVLPRNAILAPVGMSGLAIFLLTMPWNARSWIVLSCVTAVAWSIMAGPLPRLLWWCWGAIIVASSIRAAALGYLRYVVERGASMIRESVAISDSPRNFATSVIRSMMGAVGASHALYIPQRGKSTIVSTGEEHPSIADEAFHWELSESRFARGESNELIPGKILGPAFRPAFAQWFGRTPSLIWIGVFEGLAEGRGTRALILIPCARWAIFAGRDRCARSLAGLAAHVRTHLRSGQTRQASSDVVLEAQRIASEREQELNEVIHIANNVAQDISIALEEGADALAPSLLGGTVGSIFDRVRRGVYRLSTGASDVKWLKEIRRLTAARRMEVVSVESLVGEIRRFTEALGRGGAAITIEQADQAQGYFKVLSREYLESSIRFYLSSRLRAGRVVGIDSVTVRILLSVDKERFTLSFREDGSPLIQEHETLPLFKCSTLSGGVAEICNEMGIGGARVSFLRAEAAAISHPKVQDRWVLLVDDKPDVITFYSRIAEALELPYVTAQSVIEARVVLTTRGAPLLLITDIHLGGESGLELVRFFREKFAGDIPIIVVSGEVSDDVQRKALALGVTRFLPKPVSRGKLFTEIRSLVRFAGDA